MRLAQLFRRDRLDEVAATLYASIVAQARQPVFYAALAVPDTLDGRFELIALHGFLVLNRLRAERPRTEALAQRLFDTMFVDMDRGLRELGVGDLAVGKQVKAMAKSFYGRIVSYEKGLGDAAALEGAIARNLLGTTRARPDQIAAIADYVVRSAATVAAQPIDALLAGEVRFAAVDAAVAP